MDLIDAIVPSDCFSVNYPLVSEVDSLFVLNLNETVYVLCNETVFRGGALIATLLLPKVNEMCADGSTH